jgi:long-chain acyl-CoA synthetase
MTSTADSQQVMWGRNIVRTNRFLVYEPRPRSLLCVLDTADRWGGRTALVHAGQRLSYADLRARVEAGAAELRGNSVQAGDRVLLLGANTVSWVVAFWSVLRAGGIVVLGNGWWSEDEVAHAHSLTDPIVVIADKICRPRVAVSFSVLSAESLGSSPEGPELALPAEPDENSAAVIQFTSGSTGAPKGAVLSHRSLLANQHMLLLVAKRLPHEIDDDVAGEVSLQTGPLFHVGGVQALLRAMLTGGTLVFLRRRFDAGEVLETIERERVSRWGGSPTMVGRVLAHPDMSTRDLSSLRHITLGGAPASVELATEIQERFPAVSRGLSQIYGMSEAGGTLCAASGRVSAERPGVTGRPLPLVELRIDSPDSDGVGEVVVRTPTRMNGYWGETAADPIELPDGWMRTGDLGRLDADGYLYVTGRSKDVIIRGGENIAAGHVEATVLQHPSVSEIAVVGVPDPDFGEIVAATVRIRSGQCITVQELTDYAAARLAHFEVPALWSVAEEPLPVNETGKIDKVSIKRQWAIAISSPDQ